MKRIVFIISIVAAGTALTGCAGGGLLDVAGYGKSMAPQEAAVRSGQNLAMPPDLQLRAPSGPITEDYVPNKAPAGSEPASAAPQDMAAANPVQPEGDVYERNGISKVRPDGTPKTDQELQAELKALYLAKKRQKNPSYGTIFNIGNIFKDE